MGYGAPDPYSDYMSGGSYGGGGGLATLGAAATPILPWVGAGLSAAGIVSNAFGAYQKSQQADRDYEQAIRAWKAEQDRQTRLDAQNAQQLQIQNGLSGGNYARSLSQDIQAPYVNYAKSLGL